MVSSGNYKEGKIRKNVDVYSPMDSIRAIPCAYSKVFQCERHITAWKSRVAVQALAYVATYISAVALVGFGGLCYVFGMQMLLVATGNVWFGTWFVYKYLAWPTRVWQRKLNSRTPARLFQKHMTCHSFRHLSASYQLYSSCLMVQRSLKGAALMIAEVISVSYSTALIIVVVIVVSGYLRRTARCALHRSLSGLYHGPWHRRIAHSTIESNRRAGRWNESSRRFAANTRGKQRIPCL